MHRHIPTRLLASAIGLAALAPCAARAQSVVSPANGNTYVVGQIVNVTLDGQGASWSVSGPAQQTADGRLEITGAGAVSIVASDAQGNPGPANQLTAEPLAIATVTVEGALPIDDAQGPVYQQGSSDLVPAAILEGQNLRLHVILVAQADVSEPANLTLVGSDSAHQLSAPATLSTLSQGVEVVVDSGTPLNNAVAVNALALSWSVQNGVDTAALGTTTNLRIYTTYQAALNNIQGRVSASTKLHYELACTWANGASQNIGNGPDSIGYQVDNLIRHHVHPNDWKANPPVFSPYAPGSNPPQNYADLPNAWQASSTGERGISDLYYPPLQVTKPYEDYQFYADNFGWWLLDNPDYTGGRCNEQASVIADAMGTLGIQAQVHYLERTGMGPQSGRPVRQYFTTPDGGGPWNFHGLCMATLADGSSWLYDGSFSWPPNRKNGLQSWAEAENGPFIGHWADWYYDDGGGDKVPSGDIPTSWNGIQ